MTTDAALRELVPGLLGIYGDLIDRIILYGSIAHGTQTDVSGVDIAVIMHPGATAEESLPAVSNPLESVKTDDCGAFSLYPKQLPDPLVSDDPRTFHANIFQHLFHSVGNDRVGKPPDPNPAQFKKQGRILV